jgi:hypothetical protein
MSNLFQVITFDAKPADFPLRERIGIRGRIATFESQFKKGFSKTVEADVEFLSDLPLGRCAHGAADCKVYPFICAISTPYKSLPLCSAVLSHLGAKAFNSKHRSNLDSETIQLHENYRGTQSDEIHTDPEDQFIFSTMGEDSSSMNVHRMLTNYVLKNHLYYALFHTVPHQFEKYWFSDWVILFALGVSPKSGNLIGVVTHQACHNLCD